MKKLTTFILTILLSFIPTIANAQLGDLFRAFITADDPETLHYWYRHYSDCPWTEAEAENVIEGVIKRSRIKTAHDLGGPNKVYLNTTARCLGTSAGGHAVNFDVKFGDYDSATGSLLFEYSYGGLLTTPSKQFGLDSLKIYIENAVTDFVEVNFLSESN